ncbi:DUF1763-domain-containing protein [Xylaria bambusicola]|uniref:DUF1763-domain-containing protein n=1 Tax=Xylaria bambusicola TaxID=326684 RepID=UPI002008C3C0|nr:DUF1763-domain-containing protein [Xylaria bambusicola]KAI0518238.1 DUF1763-domain-containing protein [Xylaria bambusicola]
MADAKVIHAYRHIYRGLLRAVQFSKPSRYTARNQLRRAFREKGAQYDARGIARTIRFLDAATRERGLEHKVLKNLLMIAWYRYDRSDWKLALSEHEAKEKRQVPMIVSQGVVSVNQRLRKGIEAHMKATVYRHYDMTIAMLNKSMGLCLR